MLRMFQLRKRVNAQAGLPQSDHRKFVALVQRGAEMVLL
jgi:hypothetical protein